MDRKIGMNEEVSVTLGAPPCSAHFMMPRGARKGAEHRGDLLGVTQTETLLLLSLEGCYRKILRTFAKRMTSENGRCRCSCGSSWGDDGRWDSDSDDLANNRSWLEEGEAERRRVHNWLRCEVRNIKNNVIKKWTKRSFVEMSDRNDVF